MCSRRDGLPRWKKQPWRRGHSTVRLAHPMGPLMKVGERHRIRSITSLRPASPRGEDAKPQEVEVLGGVGVGADGELAAGGDRPTRKLGGEVEADGVGVVLVTEPSAFMFASGGTIR